VPAVLADGDCGHLVLLAIADVAVHACSFMNGRSRPNRPAQPDATNREPMP
jgi:hypothetical protein